jgi:hypothetical protein
MGFLSSCVTDLYCEIICFCFPWQPHQNIKKELPLFSIIIKNHIMEKELSNYFSEVEDLSVEGRCLHLLTDILMISLLTYLTGGTDYQDMHLFTKERGKEFKDLLQLPNGVPSVDTFERVFKKLKSESLHKCLEHYGKDILASLQEKQIVLDGKNLKGVSPHSKGNSGLYIVSVRKVLNHYHTV